MGSTLLRSFHIGHIGHIGHFRFWPAVIAWALLACAGHWTQAQEPDPIDPPTIPVTVPTTVPGGSAGLLTTERLEAPCYRPGSPGGGGSSCRIGLASCETELEPLLSQVKTIVKTRIDSAYQEGIDKDVFLENVQSQIGKPVCAAGGIPAFNIARESTTNHLNESCGKVAGITVGGGWRSPNLNVSFNGDHGTRERAYFRGMYLASYACQVEQILKEAREGAVRVSNPCKPLADDIRALFNRQAGVAQQQSRVFTNAAGLARFFCAQGDLQREQRVTDFCSETNSGTTGVLNSPELHLHRNSACLLRSAGASLLAAYGNFLACETFARGSAHYTDVMYGWDSPFQSEFKKYTNEIGQVIKGRCKKRRWYLRWGRTRRCAGNVAMAEHEARFTSFMGDTIQTKYFSGDACKL